MDPMPAWPYYRCIDIAIKAIARPDPARGELVLDRTKSYSMLEFGVATGASFRTLLHFRDVCLRKYKLTTPVFAVGFDTFDGMPAAREGDESLIWKAGDLPSNLAEVQRSLVHFSNFRLVKGLFSDTLPNEIEALRSAPPIFVSIDCDYYSSTMDVLSVVLPLMPNGALLYFDDVNVNLGSRRTGQLRAIDEVNAGKFGEHLELIEYPLWVETRELRHYQLVYRLFNRREAERLQAETLRARPLKHIWAHRARVSPL
jgi:hypothetical protein